MSSMNDVSAARLAPPHYSTRVETDWKDRANQTTLADVSSIAFRAKIADKTKQFRSYLTICVTSTELRF